MECPVCEGPAKDIGAPGFDGKVVRCPKCGDFEVVGSVENRLSALSPEGRRYALEKAIQFAAPGKRAAITSYTV